MGTRRDQLTLPPLVHAEHELAWAPAGRICVSIGEETWRLTSSHALWIPAGTTHEVTIEHDSLATPVWFDTESCPIEWTTPIPIDVSVELRHRLHRLHQMVFSGLPVPAPDRQAVLALVAQQATVAMPPPLPHHPQALAVATALQRNPADPRTLQDWAGELFVASKTLQRAFRTETGRTFSQWRTEARLHAALPLLTQGRGVGVVSRLVGYHTAGGFIAAFRRHFGHTPTAPPATTG